MIRELREYWVLFSKQYNNDRLKKFKQGLVHEKILDINDNRGFSVIACELYLKNGINHVLMGLRDRKYIDGISRFL
ncbi:hypothetical protein D3C87_1553200 [compost metagenome]